MKQWRKTLGGKAVCYIICVLCIALATISAISCWLMYEFNFYSVDEATVKENFIDNEVTGDGYNIMHYVVLDPSVLEKQYDQDITNLRFGVYDYHGKWVAGNIKDKVNLKDKRWAYQDFYRVKKLKNSDFNIEQLGDAGVEKFKNYYTIKFYVAENTGVSDKYSTIDKVVGLGYKMRHSGILIGIVALFGAIGAFVNLMIVSGRHSDSDDLFETFLEKIPADILIGACVTVFSLAYFLSVELSYMDEFWGVLAIGITSVMAVLVGLWLCMSLAIRIKAGNLFSNTLIWMIIKKAVFVCKKFVRFLKSVIRKLPLIWKMLVGLAIIIGIDTLQLICYWEQYDLGLIIWGLQIICGTVVTIYVGFMLVKLKNGGKNLAEGDLNYTVDTSKMILDFREHGENLNNIAVGMSKAVEDRMRSERTKTELITNVSHDIKNPLTSIINYAGLIADEKCSCENHGEYSKILVKKSEHLKRLLEDIVEISKATTGNLEVNLMPCRGDILLSQLVGEFQERCEKAGLNLIVNSCENSMEFLGDTRRIWRVFENMMSNICKYSMYGSRVYLDMSKEDDYVVFTFKNTSKDPLNITSEELMERFVRGDKSRSTEGNGLGLPITESLMELQKGKMDIFIDGDLFKVSLKFKGL